MTIYLVSTFYPKLNQAKKIAKLVVKNKMEQAIDLQVPLIVDMGEGLNWLEAH